MPLFTAQNFVNAIGGTDKITEVCIDKGGNFLAGKVTSVFQKASTTDTQTWIVTTNVDGKISSTKRFYDKTLAENYKKSQEADLKHGEENAKSKGKEPKKYFVTIEESKLDGALSSVGSLASNTLGTMGALAVGPEMISALVMEATSVATAQLSQITAKITEAPIKAALNAPKIMKEQMQKTFNEEKTTLAKEMKNFNITAEDRIEEQSKKSEEDAEKSNKKSLAAKLSSLNTSVSKTTTAINDKVSSIAKYIAEGPEWVSNQISKALEESLSNLNTSIDNTCESINNGVEEFARSQGKTAGKKLANQYNKIIEKQARKTYNIMQENKSKAKIKAFAALQKAKLKIMALTGVNIPV